MSPRYKAALVTGASSGIGSDLARALAKRCSRLAIVARRKDMLDALAKELGPETVVIEADLTDPDRAVAAVNEAFDVARRRLMDHAANLPGEVKGRETPPHRS